MVARWLYAMEQIWGALGLLTAMSTASLDPAALLPVAVATIRCGEAFKFDLYLRDAASRPVLYRGQNFRIQQSDLAALERRGIQTLFILHSSLDLYERYLRE